MIEFSNDETGAGPFQEFFPAVRGAVPWFCWPKDTKVHIVTVSLALNDAIGNFVFSFAGLLTTHRVPCAVYADGCASELRSRVGTIAQLLESVKLTDVVFFNFSIYDPNLDSILAIPAKKICYYHNITPKAFFSSFDPLLAAQCDAGRNQLPKVASFDKLMANSKLSAGELHSVLSDIGAERSQETPRGSHTLLENVSVCPPVIDVKKWDRITDEDISCPEDGAVLLYVGRIAAHKKVEDVIALFDEYKKLESESSLVIVGTIPSHGYGDYFRGLLSEKFKGLEERIHFLEAISEGQLKTVYSRCSAFVTMSEHEGFCLPLIEAMYFRKPIFAYAHPAVRETLRETGRVFFKKDLATIAADIHNLLHNPTQLRQVLTAQSRRFREIVRDADGRTLWRSVEEVLFADQSAI